MQVGRRELERRGGLVGQPVGDRAGGDVEVEREVGLVQHELSTAGRSRSRAIAAAACPSGEATKRSSVSTTSSRSSAAPLQGVMRRPRRGAVPFPLACPLPFAAPRSASHAARCGRMAPVSIAWKWWRHISWFAA